MNRFSRTVGAACVVHAQCSWLLLCGVRRRGQQLEAVSACNWRPLSRLVIACFCAQHSER